MKGKVLIMVRTSTEAQSTEDQKKELIEFCKSEGYNEKNIICIEKQGASAAKVDDDYRAMIDEVKAKVEEDKSITCFAVWHLNRLARTEEVWIEIKSFFVSHKVQIICKNPYLHLLDSEGNLDPGMELAMGLLAILSKQDQAERKAKFRRAKKANAAKGKYIGGNTIKYGYYVDEHGFFQEKPEESSVIKLIFELYATGNYSTYTLSKELEERGISIPDNHVSRIIRCEAYTGKAVEGEFEMRYPPIISEELFEQVKGIREKNKLDMKRGERLCLGSKIVKCPKCGATCTSNSRHYVCCRHVHHGNCDNGFALRQCVADNLLWRVASILHVEYLTNLNSDKEKEYRQEMAVLNQKIAAVDEKIEKVEVKKARIVGSYMEVLIDKKTRDLMLSKVQDEVDVYLKDKASLQAKLGAISVLLEGINKDLDYINAVADAAAIEYSDEERYDIVHKHILSLTAEPQSFGHRDPRTKKPNGVLITINTVGEPWKFMYVPKFLDGHNLYSWSRGRWVPDLIEITDKKVSQ